MKIEVLRIHDSGNETLGIMLIDGQYAAHTLEDEYRAVKVMGETRIPDGTYKVVLRTEGSHHIKYAGKFPDIHKGMLHVIDVPGFQYILIHIGNTQRDTAGCLLVGSRFNALLNGIEISTERYKKVYKQILQAILKGDSVTITYKKVYI